MKRLTTTFSTGILALLPSAASAALFTSGHADVFAVGYEAGDIEPHVHVEGGVVDGIFVPDDEYEAGDITIVVPDTTRAFINANGGRPAGPAWDFVGVGAGQDYWYLPQSEGGPGGATALGAPFAGVGTEELTETDWSTPITFQLVSVSGPGEFSMWLNDFLPFSVMSTEDGISAADSFDMAAGAHGHYNFGFTQPGIYDVTLDISGTHVVDGAKSATETFQFQVVPEPSTALFGILALPFLARRRRA